MARIEDEIDRGDVLPCIDRNFIAARRECSEPSPRSGTYDRQDNSRRAY